MTHRLVTACSSCLTPALLLPGKVAAHSSEQAFILLLPTNVYISAGVAAVMLTLVALMVIPAHVSNALFKPVGLLRLPATGMLRLLSSAAGFAILCYLLWIGFTGTHDPLENLLVLFFWTVLWIALVICQGAIGDIWSWINPWSAPAYACNYLLGRSNMNSSMFGSSTTGKLRAEEEPTHAIDKFGCWPACVLLLGFSWFVLADTAPEDPARLASVILLYWLFTFAGILLTGERYWLSRVEFLSVLMNIYGKLALFSCRSDGTTSTNTQRLHVGFPGYGIIHDAQGLLVAGSGIFALLLLGTGSFDGLNETFLWLEAIGINPLAFPGRSAVVLETTAGLLIVNALLIVIFALCVWAGIRLAGDSGIPGKRAYRFSDSFGALALTLLPIAFAYHIAHYLTAFLVNIQYTLAAISDPHGSGQNWLGLENFYVTTGFLNNHHTVEIIWLAQAGVVVFGHMTSVMLAHATAVRLYGSTRKAVLSQLPLAGFMVLYTFLGLWLLASPKGG